jgi:Chalcone isomerase-like
VAVQALEHVAASVAAGAARAPTVKQSMDNAPPAAHHARLSRRHSKIMTARRSLVLAALLLAFAGRAPAQGIEVSGVKHAPTANVGGATLQLNGAGVRYKAVFKVYAAGLYLTAKAATPDAVFATPGPKRLQVTMLRDIDANELGKLFTDGMQKNATREEFGKSIPGTLKLAELFAAKKRLVTGDAFTVDFLPGRGTTVSINGQPATEPITEPVFFTALMKIWLGANPADWQLKDALLGQPKG